ncbi:bifunctional oligoribonuclease/PAP phosphatase NrnA [Skermania sp. ID1734]|uniref:DHH family phosphoesterase n=1 Tax=Skermania sp. ID1734 TaxID=2597516 RepID=UPI0021084FCF|nr:bifunctional oligoribonuclease/PAP phosphatase NrnA [Skermania sp. ID1734]
MSVTSESGGAGLPFGAALQALQSARNAIVLCHVHPDADTIGSGLALAIALHRHNVAVTVSFDTPAELPLSMRSLPGAEFVVPAEKVPPTADVVVTVDCASAGRLGRLADRVESASTSLVIDHHASNTRFGDINLIDATAESTTAVLVHLFDEWGIEIDQDLAHCLYAGLVTDTGSFRWVRPGTHLLAERLLATGIDAAGIARSLLDSHPFGWLPMLSRVLGTARLVPSVAGGAGLVYAVVRRADVGLLGSEEVESVIDIVRTCTDASVAAVFKEVADGAGAEWSVSLRSRQAADGANVDVSAVAVRLGGGGHTFAAGYTAHGDIDVVAEELLAALG